MDLRPAVAALRDLPAEPPGAAAADAQDFIAVSSATQRVAYAYERFRNTLEPDEEDILRRRAIARILERRLQEDRPAVVTAEQLLQELLRAHYIGPVPRSFAAWLAIRIERTRTLAELLPAELREWFLRVAAVVIDRDLFPRRREEALVQLMYQDTYQRAVWLEDLVAEEDRVVQLFIGCHRALLAADQYEITYHYFIRQFPVWNQQHIADGELAAIAEQMPMFRRRMQAAIQHAEGDRLMRLLRPIAVPYRVLREVMVDHPDALGEPGKLEAAVRESVAGQATALRTRMGKRAWHSILFLFFTKTILTGLVEVPYELIFLREIHWLALVLNIGFHPLLLFFAATTARLPGERNTSLIVEQVRKIVFDDEGLPTVVLKPIRHYGALTWALFALIYGVLFLGIFWGMFVVLELLGFSLVAMIMFVVFLGLVSFLSIRIRYSVYELRLVPPTESTFGMFMSFLGLPILEFGRWLTEGLRQLNVPLFLMDRVLEAPFKILIDVVEEWFIFVRDRKEEIA